MLSMLTIAPLKLGHEWYVMATQGYADDDSTLPGRTSM
jgi:hypothetical protein